MSHRRGDALRDELSWFWSMLLRTTSVALLLLVTIALIVAGCVGIGAAVLLLLKHYAGS